MGNDTRDGHVQCLRNVYYRSAILENSGNEVVHQGTGRTAVCPGGNAGLEGRALGIGQLFFQAFVFAIERASLSAHSPHLSADPWRIPTYGHARTAAFTGSEQGDLCTERIFVTIVRRLQVGDAAGNSHAGN